MDNSDAIEKLAEYRASSKKRQPVIASGIKNKHSHIREFVVKSLSFNAFLFLSFTSFIMVDIIVNRSVSSPLTTPLLLIFPFLTIQTMKSIQRQLELKRATIDDGFMLILGITVVSTFMITLEFLTATTYFLILGILFPIWMLQLYFIFGKKFKDAQAKSKGRDFKSADYLKTPLFFSLIILSMIIGSIMTIFR